MSYPLRHQPLKTFYLVYVLFALLLVKIPFWTVTNLLPSTRPRRSWPLVRVLMVKALLDVVTAVFETCSWNLFRLDPKTLESQADKNGLVWIDPTPELVLGEIKDTADLNNVTATRVAGYWYGKRDDNNKVGQRADADEKVVYELHGGGWVIGDGSPKGTSAYLCTEMLRLVPQFSRLFQLEYRLSQGPPLPAEGAFPAALIDAVAGYHYLVEVLGFKPSNIMIMGESAGGNLVVALVRYLIAYVPSLPPPGATLLMSPTADWSQSHMGPDSSFVRNVSSDLVHNFFKGYPTSALLGNMDATSVDTNAWISPASLHLTKPQGLFSGFPPTMIIVGGAEMTLDAVKTLRDRMEADIGKQVTYLEFEDATHTFMSFSWHEPEKTEGFEEVGKWYKSLSVV